MNTTDTAANSNTLQKRFFAEPRAVLSKDGQYLTLVLPNGAVIRKHRNYFLHLLGVTYQRKNPTRSESAATTN